MSKSPRRSGLSRRAPFRERRAIESLAQVWRLSRWAWDKATAFSGTAFIGGVPDSKCWTTAGWKERLSPSSLADGRLTTSSSGNEVWSEWKTEIDGMKGWVIQPIKQEQKEE